MSLVMLMLLLSGTGVAPGASPSPAAGAALLAAQALVAQVTPRVEAPMI
jgi:hypothetical protein